MAKLVLAVGVPHPPRLVRDIAESPGKTKGEALMKQVRRYVEKAEPDVIIEVDSDHFVNFFYNNLFAQSPLSLRAFWREQRQLPVSYSRRLRVRPALRARQDADAILRQGMN